MIVAAFKWRMENSLKCSHELSQLGPLWRSGVFKYLPGGEKRGSRVELGGEAIVEV